MNPSQSPEISVQALLALRREPDALRLITERLRVKEMGPADHIRTKHEVKEFIVSGDTTMAAKLMQHAQERHAANQSLNVKVTQQRGERMTGC